MHFVTVKATSVQIKFHRLQSWFFSPMDINCIGESGAVAADHRLSSVAGTCVPKTGIGNITAPFTVLFLFLLSFVPYDCFQHLRTFSCADHWCYWDVVSAGDAFSFWAFLTWWFPCLVDFWWGQLLGVPWFISSHISCLVRVSWPHWPHTTGHLVLIGSNLETRFSLSPSNVAEEGNWLSSIRQLCFTVWVIAV